MNHHINETKGFMLNSHLFIKDKKQENSILVKTHLIEREIPPYEYINLMEMNGKNKR